MLWSAAVLLFSVLCYTGYFPKNRHPRNCIKNLKLKSMKGGYDKLWYKVNPCRYYRVYVTLLDLSELMMVSEITRFEDSDGL